MMKLDVDLEGRLFFVLHCDRCRQEKVIAFPPIHNSFLHRRLTEALKGWRKPYTCEICTKAVLHG